MLALTFLGWHCCWPCSGTPHLRGLRGAGQEPLRPGRASVPLFGVQKDISRSGLNFSGAKAWCRQAEYRFLVGWDCRYVSSCSSSRLVSENTLLLQTGGGGKDDANWLQVGISWQFALQTWVIFLKIKTFKRMYRLYWNGISLSFTFYLGNKKKTASRSCWKEADGGNVW